MTAPAVEIYLTPADADEALRSDARLGLTSTPKWLSPKWFYDARAVDALYADYPRLAIHGVVADFTTHLGGDFDVENFEHVAVWDAENERIEMRLRSAVGATVTLSQLSLEIRLEPEEEIRTEISAKFRREKVESELTPWPDPLDPGSACRKVPTFPVECPGNAKEPSPVLPVGALSQCMSGGVLLSHTVTSAVPSALKGLASGFGMGPGVSPSL